TTKGAPMGISRPRSLVLAAAVVSVVLGCATAPLQPVADVRPDVLKSFGKRWEWSSWHTPAVLGSGPIVVRLLDGPPRFETAATSGVLARFEGGDRRVLRGDGIDKQSGRSFAFELRQHRGDAPAAEAEAGSLVQLVFAED